MRQRTTLRRLATVFGIVALGFFAGATARAADDRPTEIPYTTPGPVPSLSPEYKLTSHKVVLITDNAINPRLVTLDEGQLVAWISYSPVPSVVAAGPRLPCDRTATVGGYMSLLEGTRSGAISHRMVLHRRGMVPARRLLELLLLRRLARR